MTGSPFTPEQEARIRAIYAEERDAWKKALPALATTYPDFLDERRDEAFRRLDAALTTLEELLSQFDRPQPTSKADRPAGPGLRSLLRFFGWRR